MASNVWMVRAGERDDQDVVAFRSYQAAAKHAWAWLKERWPDAMSDEFEMSTDLDEAMSEFSASSSTFEQIEIDEVEVR